MPKTPSAIPQAIREAYKQMKEVDFYYTDSQDPKIIQEERDRQAYQDNEAMQKFKTFCSDFGYTYLTLIDDTFFELLERDYYNKSIRERTNR